MPRRRRSALASLLAGVAMLGACTGDEDPDPSPEPVAEPSVAVEEAPQTYGPLVAAVVDAVAEVSVPGRPDDRRPATIYYASDLETCVFGSLRYEFDTVFGEDVSWDDVRAATEEVLAPEGFELTEQLDVPGGSTGFDAATDDGTRLEVRSKLGNPSTISLDAPVEGDCDRDRSEPVPPAPS